MLEKTAIIKGRDVIKRGAWGPVQLPVKHQLMVLIHLWDARVCQMLAREANSK